MADPIWQTWNFGNSTIFAQLCTRGFPGSLITNIKLDFQNCADFELILMRYSVRFPFHLIFSHAALSNRYCKLFCSNFILDISGSIIYYESIHNSHITSFSRSASESELSEPESYRIGVVTFSSKLFSDASTSYSTWKSTERLFRSCDIGMRMTTTNWISQELGIIHSL